jgi:plastocyanin domain-containing protein
MILMGLNMAGFSILRKYLRLPLPKVLLPSDKPRAPFVVGFFNGLLPCGPLQTMQLYALTTGSALQGATAMFIFALGTVPLMLSFGAITSFISKTYTAKILKFSGVLVIILGMVMANRGLILAGVNTPNFSLLAQNTADASMITKAEIKDGVQIVRMTASNKGYIPNVLYVQKGIPVRWIIDGEQINTCNNEIIVPSQQLKKKITAGENVIEFIPDAEDMNFSCWMGMIKGIIKVVDDLNTVDVSKVTVSIPSSGGCCSSRGTSGCCARPEQRPSIYGDDLSKVPTERLIKQAGRTENGQSFSAKGIGYELEPLLFVISQQTRTKAIFDLTAFDRPEGLWEIADAKEKTVVASFQGKQGIVELELSPGLPGYYGIFKDRVLLGIIEVVDNMDTVNLESIRGKYLPPGE